MKTMDQVIKEHFLKIGEELGWNTMQVARVLGISRRSVLNYKHKYAPHLVRKKTERDLIAEKDRWYNQDKW